MSEEKTDSPDKLHPEKEITFKGLCKATIETVKLYRSDPDKINTIGALTLVGMKSAFPENFTNEQLRNNPNLKFFNCIVWLGVEVNDAVDIIPQARERNQSEVIENVFDWWKEAIRTTNAEADLTPEESLQKRQLVKNYQREILFCEKQARELSEADINLQRIKRYRETINAISLVHNAAALLGYKALPSRLKIVDKQDLSWEALEEKYRWLTNGNPTNEIERRLCGLFNLVMGVQVIDDWYDVEDDKKLKLQTIATQVLAEEDSDQASAKIQEIANGYFDKATTFNVSSHAGKGVEKFFITLKKTMRRFPHMAGRRERLLNGGERIYHKAKADLLFNKNT